MASKKTKKKNTKLKKKAGHKLAKKKPAPRKKVANKKSASKKAKAKTKVKIKTAGKKAAGAKRTGALRKRVPRRRQSFGSKPFEPQGLGSGSAGQSGDLQGLSNVEGADSESVDELIEEGNAFEADVVSGVERADNDDEKEVRTHEVPEDDVPEEYLDKE
jgi:hypothetical protein